MFLGSLEALHQSLAVFCASCFSFSEEGLSCFTGSFLATFFSIATSFSLVLVIVLSSFSFTTLSFFTEGSAFFGGWGFLISFFLSLSLFVVGFLVCFLSLLIGAFFWGAFFWGFLLLSWPLIFLLGFLPLLDACLGFGFLFCSGFFSGWRVKVSTILEKKLCPFLLGFLFGLKLTAAFSILLLLIIESDLLELSTSSCIS